MTSAATAGTARREGWLDALRVLAAFGVIVNHTNSKVFQALTPQDAQWWLSVGWYYVSKMAVPLFVMVSGACLLPRRDSPRKVLGRMARILAALLLFSYAYYLYDAWVYWGLWPRMADLGTFLSLVWTQQITDSFWYLTFYLGLMVMLPFLQRLASALSGRGIAALAGICLLWDGLWPLAAHYVPAICPACLSGCAAVYRICGAVLCRALAAPLLLRPRAGACAWPGLCWPPRSWPACCSPMWNTAASLPAKNTGSWTTACIPRCSRP